MKQSMNDIFKLLAGLLDDDKYAWAAWRTMGSRKRKDILAAFEVYCAVWAERCENSDQDCELCKALASTEKREDAGTNVAQSVEEIPDRQADMAWRRSRVGSPKKQ
jgi:hypothetical protein